MLHANCKENLMTRFLQINKTALKGLSIFIDVAIATANMLAKLSKPEVCVVNLLATMFGDQRIEGFREKGE